MSDDRNPYDPLPAVAGVFQDTYENFERRCLILLADEQAKLDPDNCLAAVLCDAVRLSRSARALEIYLKTARGE